MAERMIEANGVELCTEPFGDPVDPPILLIMGIGGSMLWWEEGFCQMLADGGRFVIRYDHRDTGRSVSYEPGHPGYTGADLVANAVGVLDAYSLAAAHVVGISAGGGFAQLLALDGAREGSVDETLLDPGSPARSLYPSRFAAGVPWFFWGLISGRLRAVQPPLHDYGPAVRPPWPPANRQSSARR